MLLLDVIDQLNAKGEYPTHNQIAQMEGLKELFVQIDISELLKKNYIEQVSIPDDSSKSYNRIGYKVNEKGKNALERVTSQSKYFASTLEELYEKAGNEDLYKAIENNRDLLHFADYKGRISKSQIEKIGEKLEISVERIWWGDQQGQISGIPGSIHLGP